MSTVSQFPASENGAQLPQASDQKVQRETIIEFIRAYGFEKSLSEAEQNQFIQTALAGNLDPFKREIHLAVYGEGTNRKVSIITGYQIYLKRAERTGKLDGWRAWLEGEGPQMKAIVEIFRKDWSHSFTHEVYWEEAVQKKKDGNPTQFWVKQPRFQLRKVAMAQGFRLAFPDELGALPYESAELPEHENAATDTPTGTILPNTKPVKTSTPDSTENLAEQALANDRLPASPRAHTEQRQVPSDNDDGDFAVMVQRIEDLFDANPMDFTAKHKAWILDKVRKATDKAGVQKMLAYTEKVIRKSA